MLQTRFLFLVVVTSYDWGRFGITNALLYGSELQIPTNVEIANSDQRCSMVVITNPDQRGLLAN